MGGQLFFYPINLFRNLLQSEEYNQYHKTEVRKTRLPLCLCISCTEDEIVSQCIQRNHRKVITVPLVCKVIGGSRGVHPAHAPPPGTQFFHFDIQILRNVATSGVHAPLRGPRPPPLREILDLSL